MNGKDVELPINFQFKHPNGLHLLVIRQFLLGQLRLQLCLRSEDIIVREACTYKRVTAVAVKDSILQAEHPEAYMETLAKPWACEYPGGRIRLDNTAETTVGPWAPWAPDRKD